jgi:hypothetical protein
MSSRSLVRGAVLAAAGATLVAALAVALRPSLRRRALGLVRRAEPEPQQPTHIVLPDRLPEADWGELEEAIEEGRSVGSDVVLTGA